MRANSSSEPNAKCRKKSYFKVSLATLEAKQIVRQSQLSPAAIPAADPRDVTYSLPAWPTPQTKHPATVHSNFR